MKFLHFGLGITAYSATLLFATMALLDESLAFVACALLSLILGEICHRRMSTHD
jgi:hypothetical protein